MKEKYSIDTHINVQAVLGSRIDVVAYQLGRACERVLAAAKNDPGYFASDINIHVSIGPPMEREAEYETIKEIVAGVTHLFPGADVQAVRMAARLGIKATGQAPPLAGQEVGR